MFPLGPIVSRSRIYLRYRTTLQVKLHNVAERRSLLESLRSTPSSFSVIAVSPIQPNKEVRPDTMGTDPIHLQILAYIPHPEVGYTDKLLTGKPRNG
jgi:hypothetical protein